MIRIDDLADIPEEERKQAVECLDDLLSFRDTDGILSPIITGYNWYIALPKSASIITFSNIHETEAYQQDMLRDLEKIGYGPESILECIREKGTACVHDPRFRIRNDKGYLLPGLRIKDIRTGRYLDLSCFFDTLRNYPQFRNAEGFLIDENQGWELDMPFNSKSELFELVSLFLSKSGLYVYNEDGKTIEETNEEKKLRSPWTDAYETPVLLLGETALRYANELPHFTYATKMTLRKGSNEVSFVIHNKLGLLKSLPHYERLLWLGFSEEPCLGNKPFITEYIDKER